ncbi:MAG: hypothetical protein QXG40_05650, partial [Ignisphaera sp.]
IQGRTDDMFIVNGVNIWPSAIEVVLHSNPLVGNEYQIVVVKSDGGDRLSIKVESSRKLSDEERNFLARRLQYELREAIVVEPEIEVVDPGMLPRSEGKAKRVYIVSNG